MEKKTKKNDGILSCEIGRCHLSTPNLNLPSFKGRPIKLDNKLFPKVNTKKESSKHNLAIKGEMIMTMREI